MSAFVTPADSRYPDYTNSSVSQTGSWLPTQSPYSVTYVQPQTSIPDSAQAPSELLESDDAENAWVLKRTVKDQLANIQGAIGVMLDSLADETPTNTRTSSFTSTMEFARQSIKELTFIYKASDPVNTDTALRGKLSQFAKQAEDVIHHDQAIKDQKKTVSKCVLLLSIAGIANLIFGELLLATVLLVGAAVFFRNKRIEIMKKAEELKQKADVVKNDFDILFKTSLPKA